MWYVTTESSRETGDIWLRNTKGGDMVIHPWSGNYYSFEIDIDDVVGLYSSDAFDRLLVAPISPVEAELTNLLCEPFYTSDCIGIYSVSYARGGKWHFSDYEYKTRSLAYILLLHCDENLVVKSHDIQIINGQVKVSIRTEDGVIGCAVYDIKDMKAFKKVLTKYRMLKPALSTIAPFPIHLIEIPRW